jgi:hypothetical protein
VTSGCWQAETEAAPIRYVAELLDVDTDCDLLLPSQLFTSRRRPARFTPLVLGSL